MDKIDLLIDLINKEGQIIDFPWCSSLLYPYYTHFNDDNKKNNFISLVAFYGLLLEWHDQSGFPFKQEDKEIKRHDFYKYSEAFIINREKIKNKHYDIYIVIVELLKVLDQRDNFNLVFKIIDNDFIKGLRELLKHEVYEVNENTYKSINSEIKKYFV